VRAATVRRWTSLGVRACRVQLGGETFTYDGLSLVRHEPGRPDHETWLPLGDEPSEADDEAMIAALHKALLWEARGRAGSTR